MLCPPGGAAWFAAAEAYKAVPGLLGRGWVMQGEPVPGATFRYSGLSYCYAKKPGHQESCGGGSPNKDSSWLLLSSESQA